MRLLAQRDRGVELGDCIGLVALRVVGHSEIAGGGRFDVVIAGATGGAPSLKVGLNGLIDVAEAEQRAGDVAQGGGFLLRIVGGSGGVETFVEGGAGGVLVAHCGQRQAEIVAVLVGGGRVVELYVRRHGGPRKLGAAGRVALVGCDLALGGEGGGPNARIDVAETLGLLVVLDGANVEVHAGGGVAGQEQQPGPPPGVPGSGEEWQRLLGEIQRALVIAALGRHHGEGAERGDFHLPVARSRKRRIIGRFRPVPVAVGLAEPADPELRRSLHVAVPQHAPGPCSACVAGDRARGVALAFPAFRQAHHRRRAPLASEGFHLGALGTAERMLRVGGPQEGVRCAGYVFERLAGEGAAH